MAGQPLKPEETNQVPKEIVIDPEHGTGMFLIAIG
jgi:hypothetical protein